MPETFSNVNNAISRNSEDKMLDMFKIEAALDCVTWSPWDVTRYPASGMSETR